MVYCQQCGNALPSGEAYCRHCGAQLSEQEQALPMDERERLLRAVEKALKAYPQLAVSRSDKTDLEIKSVLADAHWGLGRKRVEYIACLLAREDQRTVVYWEMLKEVGAGLDIFCWFKKEKYQSDGRTRSGAVREVGYGPGGKVIDYHWDYARTREIVEQVAREHGWKFTVVLWKKKAMYS